jgi:hypothetical protein
LSISKTGTGIPQRSSLLNLFENPSFGITWWIVSWNPHAAMRCGTSRLLAAHRRAVGPALPPMSVVASEPLPANVQL